MRRLECMLVAVALSLGAGAVNAGFTTDEAPPATGFVDVVVSPMPGNRMGDCRITGEITFWVSRRVAVLDDMHAHLGSIEAGLAQFNAGSQLTGCPSDGKTIDLSGRFVNFLVTDRSASGALQLDRPNAAALASQLAQDFYRLADDDGSLIPLVDCRTVGALGSAAYCFHVVLIRDDASGAIDAAVQRETLGTKFAPHMSEADRRASRLKWSSVASEQQAAVR